MTDRMKEHSPWDMVAQTVRESNQNGIKVDPLYPWPVYWTMDQTGRVGFFIRFAGTPESEVSLPKLKEVSVSLASQSDGRLALTVLLDPMSDKSTFYRLCVDLIEYVRDSESEDELLERTVRRIWSWKRLLRGERDLSEEAERGLVGELYFLANYLACDASWEQAVAAWQGPYGSDKDFVWGVNAAEVKTIRVTGNQTIRVSSIDQLDLKDLDWLCLVVFTLEEVSDDDQGFSLDGLIGHIAKQVKHSAPHVSIEFRNRLEELGIMNERTGSERRWSVHRERFFEVKPGFPAITRGDVPNGVLSVEYTVGLDSLMPFCVGEGESFILKEQLNA